MENQRVLALNDRVDAIFATAKASNRDLTAVESAEVGAIASEFQRMQDEDVAVLPRRTEPDSVTAAIPAATRYADAPALKNVGDAERRRFNILPFTHKPEKPNPQLAEELKEEWPQILQWAIDGCIAWRKDRLKRPKVVETETNEYFSQQDTFTNWLDEWCKKQTDLDFVEFSSDLLRSWQLYAKGVGEYAGNEKKFAESMRQRGYVSDKVSRGERKACKAWRGIKIVYWPPVDPGEEDAEQKPQNSAKKEPPVDRVDRLPLSAHTRACSGEVGKGSTRSTVATPEIPELGESDSRPCVQVPISEINPRSPSQLEAASMAESSFDPGSIREGEVLFLRLHNGNGNRCRCRVVSDRGSTYNVEVLGSEFGGEERLVNKFFLEKIAP